MKKELTLLALLFCFIATNAQESPVFPKKKAPIIYIDSVRMSMDSLKALSPDDISFFNVVKSGSVIKLLGPEAEGGVVYVETKAFTQKKYWKFLSNKSNAYLQLVPAPGADKDFVYILNGTPITSNGYSELALINDYSFISMNIIDKTKLSKDYGITSSEQGIVITTKPKQPTGMQ